MSVHVKLAPAALSPVGALGGPVASDTRIVAIFQSPGPAPVTGLTRYAHRPTPTGVSVAVVAFGAAFGSQVHSPHTPATLRARRISNPVSFAVSSIHTNDTPAPERVNVSGATDGVTDVVPAGPEPTEFTARTATLYVTPPVRPVSGVDVTDGPTLTDTGEPDVGVAVTVNPVNGTPPDTNGGVHDTVADPTPGVAVTPDGARGTVAAITIVDSNDTEPDAFDAVNVNVNDPAVDANPDNNPGVV